MTSARSQVKASPSTDPKRFKSTDPKRFKSTDPNGVDPAAASVAGSPAGACIAAVIGTGDGVAAAAVAGPAAGACTAPATVGPGTAGAVIGPSSGVYVGSAAAAVVATAATTTATVDGSAPVSLPARMSAEARREWEAAADVRLLRSAAHVDMLNREATDRKVTMRDGIERLRRGLRSAVGKMPAEPSSGATSVAKEIRACQPPLVMKSPVILARFLKGAAALLELPPGQRFDPRSDRAMTDVRVCVSRFRGWSDWKLPDCLTTGSQRRCGASGAFDRVSA